MGVTIGVAELRQEVSRWLRRVEAGETLTVTNHGRPVATLAPLQRTTGLAALRAAGRISQPRGSFRDAVARVEPSQGLSLSDAVLQRRDEERF